jgi:hypothetical protein
MDEERVLHALGDDMAEVEERRLIANMKAEAFSRKELVSGAQFGEA